MNARFTISTLIVLFCLGRGALAAGGSPCDEAKALRRERLEFDVAMRTKRVELRREILDLRSKDNEMDRKMAEVEMEILGSPEDRVDSLWRVYDDISDQRDALSSRIGELQRQYSDLSRERLGKRTRVKILQLEKRSDCILNTPLTARLSEISKRLGERRDISAADAQAYTELIGLRTKARAEIEADLTRRRQAIGALRKRIDEYDARLRKMEEEVDATDAKKDRLSEELDKALDDLSNALDVSADRMTSFSKRILPLIDRLESGGGS